MILKLFHALDFQKKDFGIRHKIAQNRVADDGAMNAESMVASTNYPQPKYVELQPVAQQQTQVVGYGNSSYGGGTHFRVLRVDNP